MKNRIGTRKHNMNRTANKSRMQRRSWPGNCGYCHQHVIWHIEHKGQSGPIPLNDMEHGGRKHSCVKYFSYEKMLEVLCLAPTKEKEWRGQAILRNIAVDDIADWRKSKLRARVSTLVRLPRAGLRFSGMGMSGEHKMCANQTGIGPGIRATVMELAEDGTISESVKNVVRNGHANERDAGYVNIDCHLGRELLGKTVDDIVRYVLPNGSVRELKITAIEHDVRLLS